MPDREILPGLSQSFDSVPEYKEFGELSAAPAARAFLPALNPTKYQSGRGERI